MKQKILLTSIALSFTLFSTSLVRASECLIKTGENFSNILSFIQASNSIAAKVPGSCGAGITEKDKIEIKKMQAELLAESKKKKGNIASIISAHETKLSKAAVAAILAAAAQESLKSISVGIKQNPKLAVSLKEFDSVVNEYNQNRNRMFGGTKGISEKGFLGGNEDNVRLDSAVEKLKNSLKTSNLDPETKKILTKNMYTVLSGAYQNASKRALEGARSASKGIFWSSSILAADLITFSILSGGGATVAAGTGLRVAYAAASGATAGAGFTGFDVLGRATANTALLKKEGDDFYCKFADEISGKGRQVLHDALIAAIGGGIAGGFTGTALLTTTAGKMVGGGAAIYFTTRTGKAAYDSGKAAKKYHAQAKEARKNGNYAAAEQLENNAKSATIDAAANALGTALIFTGVSLKARNLAGKKGPPAAAAASSEGAACPLTKKILTPKDENLSLTKEPLTFIEKSLPVEEKTAHQGFGVFKFTSKEKPGPYLPQNTPKAASSAFKIASMATFTVATGSMLSGCGSTPEPTPGLTPGPTPGPADTFGDACTKTNRCGVRLSWDRSEDETKNGVTGIGYRIHWGTEQGVYPNTVDAYNLTEAEVSGLSAGSYYFVATAYIGAVESGYSNEVHVLFLQQQ